MNELEGILHDFDHTYIQNISISRHHHLHTEVVVYVTLAIRRPHCGDNDGVELSWILHSAREAGVFHVYRDQGYTTEDSEYNRGRSARVYCTVVASCMYSLDE